MAAAKHLKCAQALSITPAPAPGRTIEQVAHCRTEEVRKELEPIFGSRGFDAADWEIKALVIAVAEGSAIGQDLVLRAMALRGIYLEAAAELDVVNRDTDRPPGPASKNNDYSFF